MLAKNIAKMLKTIGKQAQEAQWAPGAKDMNKKAGRHIIIKLPPNSDKVKKQKKLKSSERNKMTRYMQRNKDKHVSIFPLWNNPSEKDSEVTALKA